MVVGASAGGVEALQRLARGLPADLPAAVLVVLHIPAGVQSVLPLILSRAGALPARHAHDGHVLRPGQILVAPPDHHLLVEGDRVRVLRGPKENGNRPAIDPLFRSAALAAGPRVVGVVLTGQLDDGSAGLMTISRSGGRALVQDPDEALYAGMPGSAATLVPTALRVAGDNMGAAVADAVSGLPAESQVNWPSTTGGNASLRQEVDAAAGLSNGQGGQQPRGHSSTLACPDCHGVLWEADDDSMLRYRCRTGHAYTAEVLVHEQDGQVEAALWVALRSLEERAELSKQLAERAVHSGREYMTAHFRDRGQEAASAATQLRDLLRVGSMAAGGRVAVSEPQRH